MSDDTASGQLSSDDFAASIKAKYPQYSKVDNATLTQKMLEKYPQYKDRVSTIPLSTSGQKIYSQPKFTPPAAGTDPAPDLARGISEGFHATPHEGPPTLSREPSGSEKIGRFIGREGPAIAGGLALGGAAATGVGAVPALGLAAAGPAGAGMGMAAAGAGGGAGEAFRQIFGTNPLLGQKGLTSEEAAKVITVRALEQAASEGAGRLTKGAINVIRGASLRQLQGLTNLPTQYVQRAMERPNYALPKSGESLAQAEAAGIKHLGDVQTALERTRSESGKAVDTAIERLHQKLGGKNVVDVEPLAAAMRRIVDEKYRAGDPTVQALAKSDMEKIAKVLRTMETNVSYASQADGAAARKAAGIVEPGRQAFKTVTRPMKSIRDLVQIRRELDNLVGYHPNGLPKMESDLGSQLAKTLADQYRGIISKTANEYGDKSLIMANSKFSNVATNYDKWQKVLTTQTEGEPHMLGRLKSLGNYVSQGGEAAQSLETLKEAFPNGAKSVDALHDALTRRALLKSEDASSTNFARNVLKEMAPKSYSPSNAIRKIRTQAGSGVSGYVTKGASLTQGTINALLDHIQPRDKNK